MQRVQILLTPEIKMQVTNFAQSKGISFSEAVRVLVSEGMGVLKKKNQEGNNQLFALKELAEKAALLPKPKNVPKDLSTNDDYLYKI
jgi:hypothetical protein